MPKEPRKFINPLTQSTETATYTSTETETLPTTETATFPSTPVRPAQRKRGKQAFEQTHERVTLWLDKSLKERFEALADEQGRAKSALLDEAISDLLGKYQA